MRPTDMMIIDEVEMNMPQPFVTMRMAVGFRSLPALVFVIMMKVVHMFVLMVHRQVGIRQGRKPMPYLRFHEPETEIASIAFVDTTEFDPDAMSAEGTTPRHDYIWLLPSSTAGRVMRR